MPLLSVQEAQPAYHSISQLVYAAGHEKITDVSLASFFIALNYSSLWANSSLIISDFRQLWSLPQHLIQIHRPGKGFAIIRTDSICTMGNAGSIAVFFESPHRQGIAIAAQDH